MVRLAIFASLSVTVLGNPLQIVKRDWDCSATEVGHGPTITPDTPEAFLASEELSSTALGASTPSGYVSSFKDLHASTSGAGPYLGAASLASYDTTQCASLCDAQPGCAGFNIFFERDPSVVPAASCPNPPSTTLIRCVYWGYPVTAGTATQNGQWRNNFQIVIAGSNGYNKQSAQPVEGYTSTFLDKKAINAPTDCRGDSTYMTYKLFNDGQPFSAARCAEACAAETQYNLDYLNGRATCRYFVTYVGFKNDVPEGQYCVMYTQAWTPAEATNTGYSAGGDVYTIAYSSSYASTSDPLVNGPDCSSSSASASASASSTASAPASTSSTPSTSPCTGKPYRLCCMNVAPFSTNSGVWGPICGVNDVSGTTLIGARCVTYSGSCPSGTTETCCTRTVPGQCALGVDCAL